MNKVLISITTYLKNKALKDCIDSLIETDSLKDVSVLISDDGNGNAEEIYHHFYDNANTGLLPQYINYITHPRAGIWRQKNYCIQYFLEKTNCEYLLNLDDDLLILKSGFLESLVSAIQNSKFQHMNTFLSDISCSLDPNKNSFFQDFPVIMATDDVIWCRGSQGIGTMYTREILEKVGYFDHFPGGYGYEHALFSARINRLQGYYPELFPMLRHSGKFLKSNTIPNAYTDHQIGIDLNGPYYYKQLKRVYQGYDLIEKDPSLDIQKKKKKK